ncbi:hypothetical protein CBL_00335 [Carabus blaptoides fortunei]
MMYDSMVKSIMMYGAEIWGWKEQDKEENVHMKYLRWILGLERQTPKYIIAEETKRDKMRIEAGKRAMKYEEKLKKQRKLINPG